MTANITNQIAFLRTSRDFPEDTKLLSAEVNKTYVDVANAVNSRTIGIFTTNVGAITGESWFLTNQRQQTLRQVYSFTTTANIPHGLSLTQIDRFTRCFGGFTDGTNWYGLIWGSNVAIAGQISFYVSPTNIVFLVGAGAPAITKGQVVLEFMSFK